MVAKSELQKPVLTVGVSEFVSFGSRAVNVPAKIDTGADSSSVWASNIRIGKDGVLRFSLFGEGSPFYSGKIYKRTDYKVAVVRSATGEEQIRYKTYFTICLKDRKIKVLFNLSDRSRNSFPILIGSRTLRNKFVVDVSKKSVPFPKKVRTAKLLTELRKDSYQFHQKYVKNKNTERGK
jgi:Uncharacterized protein conserved in archaea